MLTLIEFGRVSSGLGYILSYSANNKAGYCHNYNFLSKYPFLKTD